MNKNRREGTNHTYWFFFLCIALGLLVSATTFFRGHAATPPSGTITTGGPQSPWDGKWTGDSLQASGSTLGEGNCIDSGAARNCDQFALTVSGNASDWNTRLIQE